MKKSPLDRVILPKRRNPAKKQKTEGKTLGNSDEITLTNEEHYDKIALHTVGV